MMPSTDSFIPTIEITLAQPYESDNRSEVSNEINPSISSRDADSIKSNSFTRHKSNGLTKNFNNRKRLSIGEEARRFTQKASQMFEDIPVDRLKRLTETEGIGSISKETKFFIGIATMHGPLRIFRGKGIYRLFWLIFFVVSIVMLIYQIITLFSIYKLHPTVSQLSFILPAEGLELPCITICNYNPIRYSYIKELNKTGDFPKRLLDYMTMSFLQLPNLISMSNKVDMAESHDLLINYTINVNSNFSMHSFYYDAGFDCKDMLKICAFGGREFDCCSSETVAVLTDLGKCYQLNLGKSKHKWMNKQQQSGVNNGLLIIADYNSNEQIGFGEETAEESVFSNQFETGFRYYIHEDKKIPFLSADSSSVSPRNRIYSSISVDKRMLLNEQSWGNCSNQWPPNYDTQIPYTASSCIAICRAKYFIEKCGCTPMHYNIDGALRNCLPYEVYSCFLPEGSDSNRSLADTDIILPGCQECKADCESFVYNTFNSYGLDFSIGALTYLKQKIPSWTDYHILKNVAAINIFYREIGYTEYSQIQSTSFVETISNVGGAMGLFLGMSVISFIEVVIYFCKIFWLTFSKKRRDYMFKKQDEEEEKTRQIQETLETFKRHREDLKQKSYRRKLSNLSSKVFSSFRKRTNEYANKYKPKDEIFEESRRKQSTKSWKESGVQATIGRKKPELVDDIIQNNLYGAGRTQICDESKDSEFLRLDIDLRKLKNNQILTITNQGLRRTHSMVYRKPSSLKKSVKDPTVEEESTSKLNKRRRTLSVDQTNPIRLTIEALAEQYHKKQQQTHDQPNRV